MAESPGIENINDFLRKVDDSAYVIPYFQRGFEWEPNMVCDLFKSILQNYYAGLILLWELQTKAAQREKWDPVWGAKLKDRPPEKAILDGQQRLASLYYAIYNPRKKFPNRNSFYRFHIDLNKVLNNDFEDSVNYRYSSSHQTFNTLKQSYYEEWAQTGKLPLMLLSERAPNNPGQKYIDSKEFENWITNYLENNKRKLPAETTTHQVYKVLNSILNYTFVYFPLNEERSLPDICNIFARVNAKGMRLSTFDLMNAFLYPKGVKLRKNLWENRTSDTLKDIDSNMNEYLLKLISLVKQNYCSSKYIYNLIPGEKTLKKDDTGKTYKEVLVKDGEEFKNLWTNACKYAEKARKIIMNTGFKDFGAIKPGFIPNSTIVPVLGAILWTQQGKPDDFSFRSYLIKWYWAAVLSEDYSGSSDSVMAKDFRDWKEWINNQESVERIQQLNVQFINDLDLKNCRKGSARYNAILCILALNDARDFFKGQIVGVGDFSNENINDHHIFPKGSKGLKAEKSIKFKDLKDCILNRTLLLDETNIQIRNSRPAQYLEEMISKIGDEQEVTKLFKSHLINEHAYEYLKTDDFDNFIEEREKDIKKHIISRLGLQI